MYSLVYKHLYTIEILHAGANGKYWKVDGDGHINSDGSEPTPFHLEMRKQSRFTIRAANGRYLKGEQNGTVKANVDLDKATHWEY